ncbi:MAG: dynamin family protein [Firmicutes bacterium]|nr:dynamin family protein [Bacillota bacterium]
MSNSINAEKSTYINKLERQIHAIDYILEMNSATLINLEAKKKLKKMKANAEKLQKKLKNDEFEIAIVGLEKAGKSTFANALMENTLLPSKEARCTFTSTQIECSKDNKNDSATVKFFTTDEFNEKFKKSLESLEIPVRDEYTYDILSETDYMEIYNKIPEHKKQSGESSVHKDILTIIRNKKSLAEYLDLTPITFTSDEIASGELTEYITDDVKSRAVEQVIIYSKKLNESKMKNAVIYDVPGFNSPTALHKEQTLERMKSADAIVMVADGHQPSITEETYKILSELRKMLHESDEDGKSLSNKLFVFANRTDAANEIKENVRQIYDQWLSEGFVPENNKDRIIFGSALVHLQILGLNNDDDKSALASFKRKEKDMPHGDGIDQIREELKNYNDTERFNVLKHRIDCISTAIKDMFADVMAKDSNDSLSSVSDEQRGDLLKLCDTARETIPEDLKKLRQKITDTIPEDKPLSSKIRDYIENNVTRENYAISDDEVARAVREALSAGMKQETSRVDTFIRKEKFRKMYMDFSNNVINVPDEQGIEYSNEIIKIILNNIEVKKDSHKYYEELKKLICSEISVYRKDLSQDGGSKYYQSLIERFSRDIYEVLILAPYTEERTVQFYESVDNFYSMSVFYKKGKEDNDLSYINVAPKNQPLCMMLLFHNKLNNAETVKKIAEDICGIAGIPKLPDEVWKYIEKATASDMGGEVNKIVEKIMEKFKDIGEKSEDFKIRLLISTMDGMVESYEPCSIEDKEKFKRYYAEYHLSLTKGNRNYENLQNDFNEDIDVLRDILLNAFIRAINIEKPFVAREVQSIDDIIAYITGSGFRDLLAGNYDKIKYMEAEKNELRRREREQNNAIVKEINSVLKNI